MSPTYALVQLLTSQPTFTYLAPTYPDKHPSTNGISTSKVMQRRRAPGSGRGLSRSWTAEKSNIPVKWAENPAPNSVHGRPGGGGGGRRGGQGLNRWHFSYSDLNRLQYTVQSVSFQALPVSDTLLTWQILTLFNDAVSSTAYVMGCQRIKPRTGCSMQHSWPNLW